MKKRIFFLILITALTLPHVGFGDDFTRKKAEAVQVERQKLIKRLSPAVIAVQALPNSTATDPARLNNGGSGSGVIIDPKGFALSNFHVTDYSPIKIGMVDGKRYDAKVIAFDEGSDIVLIKIDNSKRKVFPYVQLGKSSKVQVGDTTLAMGNPFSLAADYKPTTTLGILSGNNRYLSGVGNTHTLMYTGVLQTDTPINPGNSGGPLFDSEGQLIGINGRISIASSPSLTKSRKVNVGVGYAIPIDMIKKFLSGMTHGRDADHGILGIALADLEEVTVVAILDSSPANEVGMRVGDTIVEIDGQKPRDKFEAIHMIVGQPAGTKMFIKVKRKSPLGNGLIEEASYAVILKSRPIPMNMARSAKALEVKNFDFVTTSEFVDPKADQTVLDQILERVRTQNCDAINVIQDAGDGLLWTVESHWGTGSRFGSHDMADVVRLFKKDNTVLKRYEVYGPAAKIGIEGFVNGRGWKNSHNQIDVLSEEEIKKKTNSYERRRCWFGLSTNALHSVSMSKENVVFEKRKCYVLKETYDGQSYDHYIDRITGVEIAESVLDKEGKVSQTTIYKKWGRVGSKIFPITWIVKGTDTPFQKMVRVKKISFGLKLDPIIFEYQPGVFF